ncbi:tetratricopeptide repeat protein [Bdellovibrio sp. HCB2-146]|uniref:tetratricopeptide repeat protein n=1 Tax=Bdellovibrio sp. HCB2-146 TaxID=3394362 RepID=UPI0039BCF686
MKKFILISILMGLTACSTTPSQDSQYGDIGSGSGGGDSSQSYSDAPSYEGEEKASNQAVAEEPEAPRPPPSSSHYSQLNDAVKADNDEAIYKAATQILVQAPNDPRALNALAMYHYKKGRFDLSRYLLSKALGGQGKTSEIYSNLGIVQLAQNERREAVKSFRKALEMNSSDGVAAANLGAIYVSEKDYNKGAMVLETAYRRGVRDPRVLNNYAVALTATGKYDQAERVYQDALKASNSNKEVLFNYAVLLVEHSQKYQQGLEVINRLKFVGGPADTRNRIIALENKAKAGLK